MIVVRIEIHPHGESDRAKTLQTLYIRNIGGTHERGEYIATLGDKTARVEDYPRLEHEPAQLVSNALHALGLGPIAQQKPFDLSQIDPTAEEADRFDFSL